jgi:hypothetical protein
MWGVTVTITGSNFNPTPANNTVYFGATQAAVLSASATSLTVSVPTGATFGPISATVGSRTAYSSQFFLPTFTGTSGTIDASTLAAKVNFSAGTNAWGVAVGDLDGDGKTDLAVSSFGSNTLSLLRNTSTAGTIDGNSLAAEVDFATGSGPYGLTLGDIDGDGKLDAATANNASNTVSVYRNQSTPGVIDGTSFADKIDFSTGSVPNDVAFGDLDGDGKTDMAVVNFTSNTVSVYRNVGTTGTIDNTTFAAKIDLSGGTSPIRVEIGDVDGDGKPDLVVPNFASGTVSIYRNTSTIGGLSFAARVNLSTGANPRHAVPADLNGDGLLDLAVTSSGSNFVSVFENASVPGGVSFPTRVDFATGSGPADVVFGDVDGDGYADMAVTNISSNTLSVFRKLLHSGAITSSFFAAKVDFVIGANPPLAWRWPISTGTANPI